ncbi:MAG: class I SAM-dependent methyltransferase [Nitrospirota bacterium]
MSGEVLRSKAHYVEARKEMRRRGIDCASSTLSRILRRLHLLGGVSVGDRVKSWDVLKTVQFIERSVPANGAVLDIGAFGSEVLSVLHRLKYTALTGIDLNPKIAHMPYPHAIRYMVGDLMKTPFSDGSFDAITAISVIEHGFDADRLLREMSRILKPGGYFIASVDYWPDKIDTKGMNVFGLDWTIFSKSELTSLITSAEAFDLAPCGPLNLDVAEPSIAWQGKRYAFAWIALKKTR